MANQVIRLFSKSITFAFFVEVSLSFSRSVTFLPSSPGSNWIPADSFLTTLVQRVVPLQLAFDTFALG